MTDELDTELRRLVGELADSAPTPHEWSRVSLQPTPAPPRRTPVYLAIAATTIVVAGGIAALAVVTTTDEDPVPGHPTVQPTPPTAPLVTDQPVVTDPSTPTTVPTGADDVSYQNPPPLYSPEPFASVEVAADPSGELPPFAVMEDGIVVIDREAGVAIVVANDPAQGTRRMPLDTVPHALVAGPGDVLYGLAAAPPGKWLRAVAIGLAGDQAGQVVATCDVEAVKYTELPVAPFGHGSAGVIGRTRGAGEVLIGYVDAEGRPVESTREWPDYGSAVGDGKTWDFDVERDPDYREPFTDDSGSAPTDGAGVYWTWIGPDAGGGGDFGVPTMPVIGVLGDGGEVTWWRLPEEWQVVASDVWGTLLARRLDDTRVELAWFDPGATNEPPATIPTTTPRPEPEWPGLLDVDIDTGVVRAPGYNDWVADTRPAWADDAQQTAVMLTPPVSDPAEVVTIGEPVDGGLVTITATVSNLLDDSTEAVRYEFRLDSADVDGLYRFVEGSYSWRCQPGRGHQDFTVEPCI